MRFIRFGGHNEDGENRRGVIEKALRQKALAFLLIAMGTLGTVLKAQWDFEGGPLLDGILAACLVLGLAFWIGSKRIERRVRQDNENVGE